MTEDAKDEEEYASFAASLDVWSTEELLRYLKELEDKLNWMKALAEARQRGPLQ
jgi:hypothetical protein